MDVNLNVDAVVVGSGAGGAAAAWRLTQKGLKVLLLEAGPRFNPLEDYPQTDINWQRKLFPTKIGSQSVHTYGDLGRLEPEYAHLRNWNRVGPERFAAGLIKTLNFFMLHE